MPADAPKTLTLALKAAAGDREAAAELLPLIYDDLRKLARARMAKLAPGQTLQPTALVHEAYVRVIGSGDPGWDGRGHFFAAAAQAMRNVLVDQARRKAALKHGGGRRRLELADSDLAIQPPREDILALDEALKRLETDDPRKGQVVNLRYFAGLTAEETAAALDVSVGTVEREWRYIKAWLHTQLAGAEAGGSVPGEDEG
ncbi:MAG: sigma-70 family RNA polymerase sigma factor [Planctomycetota bacterium]|jgi:RNA polymerase sigma factor (TIGR02999 family)